MKEKQKEKKVNGANSEQWELDRQTFQRVSVE